MPPGSLPMSSVENDSTIMFAGLFSICERVSDNHSTTQIGEISLMKEMTAVATTMMTDEEKAEMEKELNADAPTPSVTTPLATSSAPSPSPAASQSSTPAPAASTSTPPKSPSPSPAERPSIMPSPSEEPSASQTELRPDGTHAPPAPPPQHPDKDAAKKKDKKAKISPEKKKELQELDEARRKRMNERIDMLTKKLAERLRPFVDAKHPGDKEDPETQAFEEKMRREAEDLKLESFGVELLHAIGTVYMMKATSALKSRKFLGMLGCSHNRCSACVTEQWILQPWILLSSQGKGSISKGCLGSHRQRVRGRSRLVFTGST
jgi:hypothetical protein